MKEECCLSSVGVNVIGLIYVLPGKGPSVYAAHTGGILKEKNPIRTALVPLTLRSRGLSYPLLNALNVLQLSQHLGKGRKGSRIEQREKLSCDVDPARGFKQGDLDPKWFCRVAPSWSEGLGLYTVC